MSGELSRWPVLAMCLLSAVAASAAPENARKVRYRATAIVPVADASCEPGFQRFVYARRINESGVVVGHEDCYVATGDPAAPYVPRGAKALRWSMATGPEILPSLRPDSFDTYARSVNDRGDAVGREFPPDPVGVAVSWPSNGGASEAITPAGCDFSLTAAEGINNRGSIAGSDYRLNELGYCAARWILKLASGEEIEGPAGIPYDINDNDVLVGDSGLDIVRWSPSTGATTLFSTTDFSVGAQAWSINDRNEAVGEVMEFDGETGCTLSSEAKFWAADGSEHTLPLLRKGVGASAFGINNQGQIVGHVHRAFTCDSDPSALRAVTWVDGRVRNLNALTSKAFSRDYQLIVATGINERGQITVRGIRRNEPPVRCPTWEYDPETGEEYYDADRMCRNEYAFLLTPVR